MRSKVVGTLSIVVLLALLLAVLPACATQSTAAPSGATGTIKAGNLEVGVLWEQGNVWYDQVTAIGASLEKDYPGTKVKYTFNNTDARPAVDSRWQAGDPLDVDLLFNGLDANTFDWVTGNYLLDLTSAMNAKRADGTTWKDDFLPLFIPSMSYQDKMYGAPEGVYLILLHYNKKIFDQNGLTPPKTWDELLKICATLKSKNITPIIATGQVDYYVGMWSDYLFQRFVGTEKMMEYLYGTKGTKLAGDADALKALQEMQKLPPYLIDGWQGVDFTTSQVYFFQDKAAMILMGSWLMAEMKETIPPDFQLAVAGFPSVAGGKGKQDSVFGSAFGWSVAAKSKVPDLAIEYLRRFSSNEWAGKRASELGVLSCNKAVPAPPAIIGAKQVMADAANAELIVYHWGTINAKFGLQSGWYDPILKLWGGKLTPEQALAALDTNIEGVRSQRAAAKK